jgi:hypothetical protein
MSWECRAKANDSTTILRVPKMVRMTKFISLLTLLLTLYTATAAQSQVALPPNQLELSNGNYTLPLTWKGDSLHGQWEPHAALLIPVYLPGCPAPFYMQFDTGSPYSLFYTNKLQAIHRKYPAISYLQTIRDSLKDMHFKAGKLSIKARAIAVNQFDSRGIDWNHKTNPEIIGSLGTDLIENKVVVIDYPRQQLSIADSLPADWQHKLTLTDFMFMQRRILLPATLLNKKTILYFDSGSSAFTLLTDQATCLKLSADSTPPVRYPVQSWNKTLIANTIATHDSITVATLSLPLYQVTWIEGASAAQVNQMMKMGLGGMTGNKLFLSYVLVLDTKNKKMGLIKTAMPLAP